MDALAAWGAAGNRGIVSVVTGGGKTIFALSCVEKIRPIATLVVVPTNALLDQWWEESANYFDLPLDDINVITGSLRFRLGAINLCVINTAARLPDKIREHTCFLIVDECHKAASEHFRKVLQVNTFASLGLSATPERPYDDGLSDVLIPRLGPVIYSYDYRAALRDGVIVPFDLHNVVFTLEDETKSKYDKLTSSIARSIDQYGFEADRTISLLLKRARVLNLSLNRVRLALRIIARNQRKRTLVFHEDIEACNVIHEILVENGVKSGLYHSRMKIRERADMLRAFRAGSINVLVTCRALDEGFNVPETEIGIIAASSATYRQRIQRLGRILRPSKGKNRASIYTLVATAPEIRRLKEEEAELEGVAEISWSQA